MFSRASIRVPVAGWMPVAGDESAWSNGAGDVLSLHYFALPPDFPAPLNELTAIRRAYRHILGKRSAIVEVEPAEVQGCPALRAIFKMTQDPGRFRYMAALMIPFRDHHFMLKVTCPETGEAGVRDVAVAMRLAAAETREPAARDPEDATQFDVAETRDWCADPYDASFANPVLRNRSEDIEWDSMFPDHPLTRARFHLQNTLLRAELPEGVRDLAPFEGPTVATAST